MVICSNGDFDKRVFAGVANCKAIYCGKLHRVITWKNFIELFKLKIGLFQSLYYLLTFKPDVIFSKGGFVSFPVVLWARILRIPYAIHESDIEMGYVNRFAARGARVIFTGFPDRFYNSDWLKKIRFSGQLIMKPVKGKFDFGFSHKKPVVLITGGSQGSKVINEAVINNLDILLKKYNLIHQTGSYSFELVVKAREALDEEEKASYFVTEFLGLMNGENLMHTSVCAADLVVSRCGLNTLAEIALALKPVIMIPYKHSSADHQRKNALEISKITGFPIIADDDLTPVRLVKEIEELFKKENDFSKMTSSFKELFPSNGLDVVADYILKEEL